MGAAYAQFITIPVKLDIVAQGMGPCLRAVQAVHLALQASSGMV